MVLGPGYMVSKQIRLVRVLGRGGMGTVWVADHLVLKTQVAVKFMSEAFAADPAMVTRFEREATSTAQIKSPHIVHILDHGIASDELPYIVMELLEGEDLSTRLRRDRSLPIEHVAAIVFQICKALSKTHQLGIIHRDIKPSNIFLLDTDGDIFVKVLDFGIAKGGGAEPSEVTRTGAAVGTVVYMSPEQLASAKHVDFRADLWSVAVVAYRAMTGRLPFVDENGLGSLFRSIEAGSFPPASSVVSDLPPEVDDWFRRAFKRDSAARFASAREMAAELFRALGQSSSMNMPLSLASPSLVEGGESAMSAGEEQPIERGARASGAAPSHASDRISRGGSSASGAIERSDARSDERSDKRSDSPLSQTQRSPQADASAVRLENTVVEGRASAAPPKTSLDPESLAASAANTSLGAAAGTNVALASPRAGRRTLWLASLALVGVAILVIAGVGLLRRAGPDQRPVVVSEASPAAPKPSERASAGPPPVTSTLAAQPPSAGASATAITGDAPSPSGAPTSTAAPEASAPTPSTKPTSRPGGSSRPSLSPRPPEKDYGF